MIRAHSRVIGHGALILGVVVFFMFALFARGEVGTTFATGSGQAGLELKIDSSSTYNGVPQPELSWSLKNLVPGVDHFFHFDDVKPGDSGENTISLHIEKNPAYVCLDFKNLRDEENGMNEPEALVDHDVNSGELADGLEFFAWHDDGDNVFEKGEKPIFGTSTQSATVVLASTTYSLADALTGGSYAPNSTHYFGITWCAGNLLVDLSMAAITCDPTTLGNEAQTDSMSVDVQIIAVQANERPGYRCNGGNVEGCSPGYWKQSQHFGKWSAPYTPNTLFGSVFENAFPGKTLLQVLSQGGGGLNALGRQTVAALLNAASLGVDYPYSPEEVITKFNAVYPSENYDALKSDFEYLNTIYCPLGRDTECKASAPEWQRVEQKSQMSVFIEKGKSAWKRIRS